MLGNSKDFDEIQLLMKRKTSLSTKQSKKVDAFLSQKDQLFGMSFSQQLTDEKVHQPAKKSIMFFQSQNLIWNGRAKSAKNPRSYTFQDNSTNRSSSCNKRKSQQASIKWIGVKAQKSQDNCFRQVFPVRKQKSEEQCLGNFMLKYGRQIKMAKSKNNPSLYDDSQNIWSNRGASNKLKPRLTWYDRKKLPHKQKQSLSDRKNNFGINWHGQK